MVVVAVAWDSCGGVGKGVGMKGLDGVLRGSGILQFGEFGEE